MNPHYDVAIVGAGPAGLAAGLFTARYGLRTLILDRGKSLLKRCVYLDNFLGFPGGIDVAAFLDLARCQVVEAGCTLQHARVVAIERDASFTLRTERRERASAERVIAERASAERVIAERASAERVIAERASAERVIAERASAERVIAERASAERVIAASGYDFDYLRSLTPELLDENADVRADALDRHGRTALPGLYIAGPLTRLDNQALISAGQAAQVALGLIHDVRIEAGIRGALAKHVDWQVRRGCYDSERWAERVRAHFRASVPWTDDPAAFNAMIENWILAKRDKQLAADDLKHRRAAARRLRGPLDCDVAEKPA